MKTSTAWAILTMAIFTSSAEAQSVRPFGSSPVPCNSQGFSNCRVSYDGATVTRTYMHVRGGQTTAIHSGCTVQGNKIACQPGAWTTDKGFSGNAESLTVTIGANGRPTGTGH